MKLLPEPTTPEKFKDLIALYESDAVLIPQPGQRVAGVSAIRESLIGFLNLKRQHAD